MGVNDSRQTGLDEAVQVGSTAAKVVEGAAKAGKITAAAANGAALGGPYGAAASVAIAAAKHGKKILLALLAILAIPLLFLVMLPTLIFGGTAQTTGDTTILNDQAAITENMNEIAFAVSDLLGSGIADAEQRIADDFAASSADQYEIVNPYENERINNVNLFISQYCAYRDTDVAAISLEDMKQLLRAGIGELYDYTYEDETREIEETILNEDGEEVTELREVTVRVYTLSYRGEAYFADSIFHLTTEQKTLAQNFAENLSLFLGDGLFQNLSSSESSFTIPALGNIRYTDGGTEVVYYNQLDERYANKPYGTDNIGGYGCGPTCMAMVVSSLTDDLVDPVEMAKWSYEHGYWCSGSGSYHALIPAAAEAWGLPVSGCTASEPQRITDALSSGKLIVALEGAWQPWSYHDESDTLVGYDVEVSRAIAEKLGVEPEYVESDWDSLFAGLDAGRFDMVCNGVEVTDERALTYDFTTPYGYIHTALAVRKDNDEIKTFEDLKGKTTANSLASTYMELAESYGATVQGIDTLEETIQLLAAGRIDATLNADVSFYDYLNVHPDANFKIVAQTEDASHVAIPLRKGDNSATLLEAVNNAIDELRADGTLKELSEKYFGQDISSEN